MGGNRPGDLSFCYRVLGIQDTSSLHEIRTAYRHLAKKWHPDKHPPSARAEAEAQFKAITQAYEALCDKGENWPVVGGMTIGGGGDDDPRRQEVEEVKRVGGSPREFKAAYNSAGNFGAGKAFSRSILRKPPAVERRLECSLEEFCFGCKKEVKFSRDVVTKNGLTVKKEETQIIRVKPGMKKGTKITLQGMGDERPGSVPADIVYIISEKKHPSFKRAGSDLVLKVEVPLVNALTGWNFSFRLLNGEKMSLSFNDKVIQPGYEKVLKGQGMPLPDDRDKKGDIRIKFHIAFPENLSEEQRLGLSQILRECS